MKRREGMLLAQVMKPCWVFESVGRILTFDDKKWSFAVTFVLIVRHSS